MKYIKIVNGYKSINAKEQISVVHMVIIMAAYRNNVTNSWLWFPHMFQEQLGVPKTPCNYLQRLLSYACLHVVSLHCAWRRMITTYISSLDFLRYEMIWLRMQVYSIYGNIFNYILLRVLTGWCSMENYDSLPCPRPVKSGSVLKTVALTMPTMPVKFTRYCLTPCISRPPMSVEIHWFLIWNSVTEMIPRQGAKFSNT